MGEDNNVAEARAYLAENRYTAESLTHAAIRGLELAERTEHYSAWDSPISHMELHGYSQLDLLRAFERLLKWVDHVRTDPYGYPVE